MSTVLNKIPKNHCGIVVPVKTYLVKFIAKNYSVEPFIVKKNSCHISAIILDQIKKSYSKPQLAYKEEIYTQLTCMVPLSENKFTVDQETVLRINQNLKEMFDQQLSDMVSMTNKKIGDIRNAVFQFCDYYGITEDDLKYDTVVKMYYRARYYVDPTQREKHIKEELHRHQQLSFFEAPTNSVRSVPGVG